MDKSAIILTCGFSSSFAEDKGVLELAGKPLIKHVVDAVRPFVDEIIVVTDSEERVKKYSVVLGGQTRFAVDSCESKGPLIGALTGFEVARGKYASLLAFDTPFVSREVVSLLFDLCLGKAAAIPRWPNGQIQPLQAVYQTAQALEAAKSAVTEGKLDMRSMIEKMRGVRYISTLVIEQVDPELQTFFNINTLIDLKSAEKDLRDGRREKSGHAEKSGLLP